VEDAALLKDARAVRGSGRWSGRTTGVGATARDDDGGRHDGGVDVGWGRAGGRTWVHPSGYPLSVPPCSS